MNALPTEAPARRVIIDLPPVPELGLEGPSFANALTCRLKIGAIDSCRGSRPTAGCQDGAVNTRPDIELRDLVSCDSMGWTDLGVEIDQELKLLLGGSNKIDGQILHDPACNVIGADNGCRELGRKLRDRQKSPFELFPVNKAVLFVSYHATK